MRRQLFASAAAIALFAVFDGTGIAVAQDAGGNSGASQNLSVAADQAPAADAQAPATSGGSLPEVKVIQQQAKPKPVKQAKKPKPRAAPQPVAETAPTTPPVTSTSEVPPSNVKMSPFGASSLPVEKVPASVSQVTTTDFKRDETVIPQEALQARVPGIIVGDLQGNQFQTNVQYRGFEASPVNGVAQGLAVYQNGTRINEAFGDIVNWDFLPSNAINNITVMSGNPIFGLNALGGAISIEMKDGFNYQGAEVDTRFGSFGRKQVSTQAGQQVGNFGIYGAFEAINDDGFRDFSDAEVRRGYLDLGFKNTWSEFHFNFTGADNHVGVTAAAPEELLAEGWDRTFTSPQTTDNILQLYQLNGTVKATETLSVSGNAYYRKFKQKHVDGNIAEATECGGGLLCIEDGLAYSESDVPGVVNSNGTVNYFDGTHYGSVDRTGQDADSWGTALQATDKSRLFGYRNQFTIGTSYDHGHVGYTANSELGIFQPRFVVGGTGVKFGTPPDDSVPCPIVVDDDAECWSDDTAPRDLTTTNDYFGAYFINTTDLTDRLALTVGGRFNYASITIKNNTDNEELEELNGTNTFNRFNPIAGLTYQLAPGLSLYSGYSEANRAPTPAELACANPELPCIIESFLTADPPLNQVVSRTVELGIRGEQGLGWEGDRLNWSLGVFRTLNTDDILSVADETSNGRGYFLNAGDTLRQGIEAAVEYRSRRLYAYANYTFLDATFRDSIQLSSPDNPHAGVCEGIDPDDFDEDEVPHCVQVRPGDRLPGTPRHRFKVGFDYWMTPKWKFGSDLVALSSQFFTGDEANQDSPLPGFARLNLHTSYDVTDQIQVYGLFENVFDRHYGLYGTYYNAELANVGGAADIPPITFEEPDDGGRQRSITPAIPFAAYGGVKVKF
ncbi:TonB-dependent receptor [Hyphomicrobium denitrificans 1NES1]|uniref:TonB-dependent receptor n=1 Tax=Hyphomicrobium denitrificans 1NES1 TaxID=670307 RepID=N0B3A9_9HYPH|nr:TonB-dependent receptor [Hyphomicrobium denitrificans]AGK56702.1 TonB-dependent receptor [Hyphomicrobium denitrificans 1NES1]